MTLRIDPESGAACYRGRPVCLLAASEHYGAVINASFDYRSYLDQMSLEGLRLTRTFALFRELQSDRNPYSTCKPESTEFVAPYRRTGPGIARDGLGTYDLEQWNPQYFARLHDFLSLAMEREIIVELTLLSNTYSETVWALSPLHGDNNVNSLGPTPWHDYLSMRNPALWHEQQRFVRKILEETEPYDNLIIELCNEPIGNFAQEGKVVGPTPAEVDAWQVQLADLVRTHAPDKVIAASPAWSYEPWGHPVEPAGTLKVDVCNVHPLDVMTAGGETFNTGEFMSADSRLAEYQAYCRKLRSLGGAVNLDEDNNASRFMDERGWTIHRQRAWIGLLSGCHYDFIDFAVRPGWERGTGDDRRLLRARFATLARFWAENSIWVTVIDDDAAARPPDGCTALAVRDHAAGTRYVYIAAQTSPDVTVPFAAVPIDGELELNVPEGQYLTYWFSPETGQYFGWATHRSPGRLQLRLPQASNDVVAIVKEAA